MSRSSALPTFMWRDPAEAYERIEASTCQGCTFLLRYQIVGTSHQTCAKGKIAGVKCKQYLEDVSDRG